MASRRWLTIMGALALAVALATPAMAQGRGGGGGGGKKKDPKPVAARQVSIDDALSVQLKSDGKVRLAPTGGASFGPLGEAADGDGDGIPDGPVVYQDHLIPSVDLDGTGVLTYADPCVSVGSRDKQFDFDESPSADDAPDCNIAFPEDGRTFTIVFVPADPGNAQDPVHTVCDQFRFLIETDPVDTWGSAFLSEWQTGFAWNDPADLSQGCTLTPSTGAIITDPEASRHTANAQFWADPWETQKVKGRVNELTHGNLNINFRVDRPYQGGPGNWQVKSQEWDLPILCVDAVGDDVPCDDDGAVEGDTRRTISADTQRFDLCLAGSGCLAAASGFTLPLRITYRRVEVAQ